jgi:hypothetical protein
MVKVNNPCNKKEAIRFGQTPSSYLINVPLTHALLHGISDLKRPVSSPPL